MEGGPVRCSRGGQRGQPWETAAASEGLELVLFEAEAGGVLDGGEDAVPRLAPRAVLRQQQGVEAGVGRGQRHAVGPGPLDDALEVLQAANGRSVRAGEEFEELLLVLHRQVLDDLPEPLHHLGLGGVAPLVPRALLQGLEVEGRGAAHEVLQLLGPEELQRLAAAEHEEAAGERLVLLGHALVGEVLHVEVDVLPAILLRDGDVAAARLELHVHRAVEEPGVHAEGEAEHVLHRPRALPGQQLPERLAQLGLHLLHIPEAHAEAQDLAVHQAGEGHVQNDAVVHRQAHHHPDEEELLVSLQRVAVEPQGAALGDVDEHAVVRLEDLGEEQLEKLLLHPPRVHALLADEVHAQRLEQVALPLPGHLLQRVLHQVVPPAAHHAQFLVHSRDAALRGRRQVDGVHPPQASGVAGCRRRAAALWPGAGGEDALEVRHEALLAARGAGLRGVEPLPGGRAMARPAGGFPGHHRLVHRLGPAHPRREHVGGPSAHELLQLRDLDHLVHAERRLGMQDVALGLRIEQEREMEERELVVEILGEHAVLAPDHVLAERVKLLADEVVVELLHRQHAAELGGFLHEGERLDGGHHALLQPGRRGQAARDESLQRPHNPRCQDLRGVLAPPAHQDLLPGRGHLRHDAAEVRDELVPQPLHPEQRGLRDGRHDVGALRHPEELLVRVHVAVEVHGGVVQGPQQGLVLQGQLHDLLVRLLEQLHV
mmetsp:Transcript_147/g.399  ORF Transcript_147/g.399 Transcript_147/m.399 type:complete len:713 (+) Transcript_147:1695-3833(+)